MSWTFVAQLAGLSVFSAFLVIIVHGALTDKRREDDYKRKENGL